MTLQMFWTNRIANIKDRNENTKSKYIFKNRKLFIPISI